MSSQYFGTLRGAALSIEDVKFMFFDALAGWFQAFLEEETIA